MLERAETYFAISITVIAGTSGGSEEQPSAPFYRLRAKRGSNSFKSFARRPFFDPLALEPGGSRLLRNNLKLTVILQSS